MASANLSCFCAVSYHIFCSWLAGIMASTKCNTFSEEKGHQAFNGM